MTAKVSCHWSNSGVACCLYFSLLGNLYIFWKILFFNISILQIQYITNLMCFQVKLEGDINQGVAYYKRALYYNWHYADAMYNLGVAYGEMLKFEMVHNIFQSIIHSPWFLLCEFLTCTIFFFYIHLMDNVGLRIYLYYSELALKVTYPWVNKRLPLWRQLCFMNLPCTLILIVRRHATT